VAADRHGVKLTSLVCNYRRRPPEVRAFADDGLEAKVQAWFLEDALETPFPAGSLLHYARVS
jgi:hypothetical protein